MQIRNYSSCSSSTPYVKIKRDANPQKKEEIKKEDTSKRSANMKYFVNEDHSYTAAVYVDPVHYLDNGEWKEINNQLQDGETEEGTGFLENKKNSLSVKFAKKSNGNKLV